VNTIIYYFSGTGNSLKIAKDIAAQLGDTKLTRIQKPFKKPDLSADRIGIVFPCYMWGVPLVVKEFAQQLGAGPDKYIFAVSTYGGFQAGTLPMLAKALKAGGMKLSTGFGLRMPGNYTPMYGAIPEATQKKNFECAAGKIGNIVETVKAGKSVELDSNNWIINTLFSGLIYKGGSKKIRSADTKFHALDTCTKCGICAKVCPVENIKLVDGRPQWLGHCEQCLACLQWCPVEAIQLGKKTIGRKRYHHPDVKVNDFVAR
jgi:ferredoxin